MQTLSNVQRFAGRGVCILCFINNFDNILGYFIIQFVVYSIRKPSARNIIATIANTIDEIISTFLFFFTKPVTIPINEATPLKIINGPIKFTIILSSSRIDLH